MQSSIGTNVMYYAYASFSSAPQISQAFIVSIIVGGVLQLPIAKALNPWGRAEGFLTFLAVFIIGLSVTASCNGPNGFAAGYTLYGIGYTAINFILSVFVADASGLRNRAFVYAFIGMPSICTAFVGPLAAQAFITHSTWRWAYGCFGIITLVIFVPLALVFKFYQDKAEKANLFVRVPSGRTTAQSFVHYFHEFDIIGAFILMAAFIFFLLPFSLSTYGLTGYSLNPSNPLPTCYLYSVSSSVLRRISVKSTTRYMRPVAPSLSTYRKSWFFSSMYLVTGIVNPGIRTERSSTIIVIISLSRSSSTSRLFAVTHH